MQCGRYTALAVVFTLAMALCAGCSDDSGSGDTSSDSSKAAIPAAPTDTLASKLATIDTGQYVGPNDPRDQKYQDQLDTLNGFFKDNTNHEPGISDMAVYTQQVDIKKGVDEDILSVLEAVNQACQNGIPQGKGLSEVFTAYSVLRVRGLSRDQAISQTAELARQLN